MEELPERNWDITYIGAAAIIAVVIGFMAYMASGTSIWRPLALAAGAGAVFAVSARAGDADRLRSVFRPFAGFLAMVAGGMLVGSVLLFATGSVELVTGIVDGFDGDSVLGLVRAVMLPILGYVVALSGAFLAGTGAVLVAWDRIGDRVPVGAERADLLFTGILGALTVAGVFGSAILRDLPPRRFIVDAWGLVTGQGGGAVIAGILVFMTYRVVRRAWRVLPIRELVPRSARESYDRLARWETVAAWVVVPLLALATAVQDVAGIPALGLLSGLTTPGARTVLAGATGVAGAAIIGVWLLRQVAGGHRAIKRLLPYILFGLAAYLMAPLLTVAIDPVLARLPGPIGAAVAPVVEAIGPTQAVMVGMTVASGLAVMLKIYMNLLRSFGLVPEGLEGTTLVAAGLFFAAVGFHLYSPAPVVLFTGVGAAMALWELGKRSVILGEEVGRAGSTYQAELVQVVSKLVVVGLVVVVARTLLVALETIDLGVPAGPTGVAVFLATVAGLALLLAALKDVT